MRLFPGLAITDPNARDRSKWRGQNLLGKLLTELRDELMREARYREEVMKIVKTFREQSRRF